MFTRVVDEHIDAFMRRDDFSNGFLPGIRTGNFQVHTPGAVGKFGDQLVSVLAVRTHAEPDKVLRGFFKERTGKGPAKSAVATGNKNDSHISKRTRSVR